MKTATPAPAVNHDAMRELYKKYLDRKEALRPHQEYAKVVIKATDSRGQSPVRPFATMGTGGGPLLCDHCGKAIILEGGKYNNVPADIAWQKNPARSEKWVSWILGGVVVELQSNDTLRIYHGYINEDMKYCCNVAKRDDDKKRDEYEAALVRPTKELFAFIRAEFPDLSEKEQLALLNDINNTYLCYDPGVGINKPTEVK
jgi:hypothetical protein